MISKTASAQANAPNSTPSPAAPSPSPNTTANFSDVPADYWAQPFIQALAARNIITGFPDGTFGPEQPVDRAEFAAMIQKAFERKPVRHLLLYPKTPYNGCYSQKTKKYSPEF